MTRLNRFVFYRRLDEEQRRIVLLVRSLFNRYWYVVAIALTASLLAAVFEGSTMAIFSVALEIVAGNSSADVAESVGVFGETLESLWSSLGDDGFFLVLIGAAVLSQLLRNGLEFGGKAAAAYLAAHVSTHVRGRIFRQFMRVSFAQVSRYKIGDLTSYTEQSQIVGRLVILANTLTGKGGILLAYFAVLFWLSGPATLTALAVFLAISIILRRIIQRVRTVSKKFVDESVALNEYTVEFLQVIRLLRVFSREDYAIKKVDDALHESRIAYRQSEVWKELTKPLPEAIITVGLGLLLAGGFLLLGEAKISMLPRIATFLVVLYRLMPRIGKFNQKIAEFSSLLPAVSRVADILRTDDKEYTRDGGHPYNGNFEKIEFKDVSLRYTNGEQLAVNRLSITIHRDSMIALVGESGAGKTSVADLLLRLFDPTSGQILVDGLDLREIDLKKWRGKIGVVSQDTSLFHASIYDNIAIGNLDATRVQIVAASKAAFAHEFIQELGQGYDTVVGDRGYRLSGGQRQRIAIARAILRDPEILVLDEATSDLDSRSEQLIQSALDQIRSKRTVIVIAHRLSTVAAADEIFVLERGEIVENGQHEDLLALNGHYAKFWYIQSGLEANVKDLGV